MNLDRDTYNLIAVLFAALLVGLHVLRSRRIEREPCPECQGEGEVIVHDEFCSDPRCTLSDTPHSCGGASGPCSACGGKGVKEGGGDA